MKAPVEAASHNTSDSDCSYDSSEDSSQSEQDIVNNANSQQEKEILWVKVEYEGYVKRIYKPPMQLSELRRQILRRIPELEQKSFDIIFNKETLKDGDICTTLEKGRLSDD